MPPLAHGGHQPGVPQRHQVLRDGRLAHAQHGFQVADAGFPAANCQQDGKPVGLTQQAENIRRLVIHNSRGIHIRQQEYIITD